MPKVEEKQGRQVTNWNNKLAGLREQSSNKKQEFLLSGLWNPGWGPEGGSNKMRLAAIGATLRGLWPEGMLPSVVRYTNLQSL